MGGWRYVVFLSYIFPIGMGVALSIQRRLPFAGRMLWIYMLFTLCVEIASSSLAANGINNLWLYRVYLYAELVFPSIFFFNQFSKKQSKLMLLIAFVLAIILTTLTNCFDDWQAHASVQTGITFCYVAFIIISYFAEMFRMEKVFNPFKDTYFVVGGVLLMGHSCTLIYNGLYDYLVSGYFGLNILKILDKLNICLILFYNVLYSYAIWLSRHHPT